MRRHRRSLVRFAHVGVTAASLIACREAPLPLGPETGASAVALAASRGATRDHFEFDVPVSSDFFASCIGEMVHVEGTTHVSVDVTTTPGGVVITRLTDQPNPGFFVERTNGVRYHVFKYQAQTHTIEGPVGVVASTAVLIVRSATGDRLNLSVHYQFVRNASGAVVVDKFVGVCP